MSKYNEWTRADMLSLLVIYKSWYVEFIGDLQKERKKEFRIFNALPGIVIFGIEACHFLSRKSK